MRFGGRRQRPSKLNLSGMVDVTTSVFLKARFAPKIEETLIAFLTVYSLAIQRV